MSKSGKVAASRKKTGKTSAKKPSEDKLGNDNSEVSDDLAATADAPTDVAMEDSGAKILGDEDGTEVEPPVDEETPMEGGDEKDVKNGKGSQEEQMDSECAASVVEPEMAEGDHVEETNGSIQEAVKGNDEITHGKRKVESSMDTSPSKKRKLLNDGFCLFVGNLNKSKTYEEVKDSLVNFFTTHSLLTKDTRLDHSRKFAYIDFLTEEDLTKALELNGEKILDQPIRMGKAKVKEIIPKKKEGRDARTLFVKNIPYSATQEDLQKVFDEAIVIRFLGDTDGPSKGIAFMEFKTAAIAEKVLEEKQGTEVGGRVLVVDFLGEKGNHKAKSAPAVPTSCNTLMVTNLPYNVKEKALRKVFEKAVDVRIQMTNGKSRGYAFIEFSNEVDAKEAMESSQSTDIGGRLIRIDFSQLKPEVEQVLNKTLVVFGLGKETSEETLKSTFEGAVDARVATNKDTGVSRGFGFVDFESPEECRSAMEAMEDGEIDGCKVKVCYARPSGSPGALAGGPREKPGADGSGSEGKRGSKGGQRGGSRGGPGGRRGGRVGGSGNKSENRKQKKKRKEKKVKV